MGGSKNSVIVIAPKIKCEPHPPTFPKGEGVIIVLPCGEDLGGVSSQFLEPPLFQNNKFFTMNPAAFNAISNIICSCRELIGIDGQ